MNWLYFFLNIYEEKETKSKSSIYLFLFIKIFLKTSFFNIFEFIPLFCNCIPVFFVILQQIRRSVFLEVWNEACYSVLHFQCRLIFSINSANRLLLLFPCLHKIYELLGSKILSVWKVQILSLTWGHTSLITSLSRRSLSVTTAFILAQASLFPVCKVSTNHFSDARSFNPERQEDTIMDCRFESSTTANIKVKIRFVNLYKCRLFLTIPNKLTYNPAYSML